MGLEINNPYVSTYDTPGVGKGKSYFVYILRTSSNTLYVGQTNNFEKRIHDHRDKKGKGSKYIRSFDTFELVHKEEFESRTEAMKRENQLKKMTKKEKEKLLISFSTFEYQA